MKNKLEFKLCLFPMKNGIHIFDFCIFGLCFWFLVFNLWFIMWVGSVKRCITKFG